MKLKSLHQTGKHILARLYTCAERWLKICTALRRRSDVLHRVAPLHDLLHVVFHAVPHQSNALQWKVQYGHDPLHRVPEALVGSRPGCHQQIEVVLQEDGNHGCLHGNVRNPVVRPTVGVDEEDWLQDAVDMTLQDLRKFCSMA